MTTATERFTFDAASHRYYLDGKPMTGVTTILNVIAKPALIHWASKMACKYVKENLTSLESLDEVLEQAVNAHTRKKEKGGEQGTELHEWIEAFVADPSVALPEADPARSQAQKLQEWVAQNRVRFLASEKKLYSEKHWIAGTCDFVAEIGGKRFVGDWKTYGKIWDRTPFLQIAGYRLMLEEMGEEGFEGGVVVNMPKDGGQMEVKYSYDQETDRQGFLAALTLYRALSAFDPKTYEKLRK